MHADVIDPVLAAIDGPEAAMNIPLAAYKALEQLCPG